MKTQPKRTITLSRPHLTRRRRVDARSRDEHARGVVIRVVVVPSPNVDVDVDRDASFASAKMVFKKSG